MRCRDCDYVLWNLSGRQCPECGRRFAPSEYEFVPSTVRFCCPHCNQAYYGTDRQGHLVPAEFVCVNCRKPLTMDTMILRPAEGVSDQQTKQMELPWQERQQRGTFRAWLKTILTSISAPGRMIEAANRGDAGVGEAWWFLTFTLTVVALAGIMLPGVAIMLIEQGTGGNVTFEEMIGFLIAPPIGIIGMLLIVALWGATAHGILRITGGCEATIGRTYQALCYGSGPMLMAAIPLVGLYCLSVIPIPQVWWVVLAIIMVQAGQSVHGGRATLAVGVFPAVLALTAVLGFLGVIYFTINTAQATMRQMGPMTGINWNTGMSETTLLQAQLDAYRLDANAWPAHGLLMLDKGWITARDFVATASDTSLEDIPVADGHADVISDATNSERRKMLNQEAALLGPDVLAHRTGDFVFTYHTVNLNTGDPSLWTIIMIEDPDAQLLPSVAATPLDPIYVARLDGKVRGFARANLATELKAQNDLRAAANLPPLPDPLTVRHRKPARIPDAGTQDDSDSDEDS